MSASQLTVGDIAVGPGPNGHLTATAFYVGIFFEVGHASGRGCHPGLGQRRRHRRRMRAPQGQLQGALDDIDDHHRHDRGALMTAQRGRHAASPVTAATAGRAGDPRLGQPDRPRPDPPGRASGCDVVCVAIGAVLLLSRPGPVPELLAAGVRRRVRPAGAVRDPGVPRDHAARPVRARAALADGRRVRLGRRRRPAVRAADQQLVGRDHLQDLRRRHVAAVGARDRPADRRGGPEIRRRRRDLPDRERTSSTTSSTASSTARWWDSDSRSARTCSTCSRGSSARRAA